MAAFVGSAWISLALPSWAQEPACDPQGVSPNSVTNGTLAAGDCRLSELPGSDLTDDSFVDVYQVTVATGGVLTVSMTSSSFDTFLLVLDETLTDVIAADDDGGGGTDSLVSISPISAGTYVILANSFFTGETGPYTLTLVPEPSVQLLHLTTLGALIALARSRDNSG